MPQKGIWNIQKERRQMGWYVLMGHVFFAGVSLSMLTPFAHLVYTGKGFLFKKKGQEEALKLKNSDLASMIYTCNS